MKPLAIDLYCGLGGWSEGLLAEGYDVIGFDIERHEYGDEKYPAQLVLQDVLTLHGSQFKDAALIVASPPCQAYSYRAMPWKRAKALPPPCNALFDACFRIQREACEAAGRHVPMVVENVRGAQPWVGRAKWHYGSFYLWGDVPALMPIAKARPKIGSVQDATGKWSVGWNVQACRNVKADDAIKNTGGSWFNIGSPGQKETGRNLVHEGVKQGGGWFHDAKGHALRRHNSKSTARKRASAMIAKIPLRLSRHIAATYYPATMGAKCGGGGE